MKLSIIIVNWNTRELLKQCLTSVYANLPSGAYEVWVVDNASKDGSSEMVRGHFPQVKLVNNAVNSGFAYANNLALRQAAGEYALLLNSDTIVKPNTLEALVRFMDEHPEAGAVGSRLLNPDGSLQVSCYVQPTLKNEFLRMLHLDGVVPGSRYKMSTWEVEKAREVDIVQGASLVLRSQTLEEVGLLDEDFFMYSEDYDLCYRIKKAGWRLYWVPWSEVIHFGGQSTRQVAADMFLRLYQSKLLCMRKHYGAPAAAAYKSILLISALFRLSVTPLAWLVPPQERQRHRFLSENYRRLLLALPNM
jgi:GT2 family glycosyltransferase